MAISLKKGQGVSLKKSDNDLSMVTIGLGWDVAETYKMVEQVVERKKSGLGGLLGGTEKVMEQVRVLDEYDLDVVAFLCGADGKVHDLGKRENGKPTLTNGDVVFFNNLRHHSGQIWLTGDNRTGAGDGDDEQIIVKLNDLPDIYAKVVFVVQIYKGLANAQSFGKVHNAFIRAEDGQGREMVRFNLSGGAQYETCRSMLFAELIRETGGWKFNAIGTPSPSDSFVEWLRQYL
ncbi:MAG: TerD family protein [Candidatus Accumulibacter sp.]|jgi:stress response protein SCP2|nr:TerD family protein [Candidatus Accumulibacter propinquus]